MGFLEKDILERVPHASNTGSNTALGVAGAFLIVPLFFMDFSEADEIEVSALIERYNHLLITAQDKSCDTKRERLPTLKEMQNEAREAKKEKSAE